MVGLTFLFSFVLQTIFQRHFVLRSGFGIARNGCLFGVPLTGVAIENDIINKDLILSSLDEFVMRFSQVLYFLMVLPIRLFVGFCGSKIIIKDFAKRMNESDFRSKGTSWAFVVIYHNQNFSIFFGMIF